MQLVSVVVDLVETILTEVREGPNNAGSGKTSKVYIS
jgi:hypothetical protein